MTSAYKKQPELICPVPFITNTSVCRIFHNDSKMPRINTLTFDKFLFTYNFDDLMLTIKNLSTGVDASFEINYNCIHIDFEKKSDKEFTFLLKHNSDTIFRAPISSKTAFDAQNARSTLNKNFYLFFGRKTI